jgi:hypothetical protein
MTSKPEYQPAAGASMDTNGRSQVGVAPHRAMIRYASRRRSAALRCLVDRRAMALPYLQRASALCGTGMDAEQDVDQFGATKSTDTGLIQFGGTP